MTRFIEKVFGSAVKFDAAHTAVVFPSLRAISYLKEEYKKARITQILPQMLTMDMLAEEISSIREEDELVIAAEAYRAFSKYNKGRDFAGFLNVFPSIMNDFNDLDMYLRDVKVLKNLKEIAKLENTDEGTNAKKYYQFMSSMEEIYFEVNRYLEENRSGYRGSIYRKASVLSKDFNKYENIIFAGFNILTKSEEKIIDNLKDKTNLNLLFNIPRVLYDNNHESAEFIIKYSKKWEKISEICDCSENEKISIYSYSLSTEQPGVISKEITDGKGAVVLCDESMMIPAIYGIPENVEGINITMGYPISMIPLYIFFKELMNLHKNRTEYGFRKSDMIDLLGNSYIKRLDVGYFGKIEEELKIMKITFVKYEEIFNNEKEEIIKDIFEWYDGRGNMLYVEEILEKLKKVFTYAGILNKDRPLIESSAVLMINTLNRIITLLETYKDILIDNSAQKIDTIVSAVFLREKVPFSGNPITEFQMMGMLETRCLQFDKTLILSVNEGTIPKPKRGKSFLPYEIRKEMALPTYEQNDKLFSYYFYTLLLNSRESVIAYSRSNSDSTEERSRLIEQILWEHREGGIFEKSVIVMHSPETNVAPELSLKEIEKSAVVEKMMKRLTLSPSSIIRFMNCPIDFYFGNVLSVDDSRDDELGMDIIGTAAHKALQNIYMEQLDKEFCREQPDYSDDIIKQYIDESFNDAGILSVESGKPLLMQKAVLKMVRSFIESDIEKNKERIVLSGLEKNFSCTVDAGGKKIIMKGTFDRIELAEKGSVVRIMDYKSGRVDSSDMFITNPELLIDVDNWMESDSDKWSKKFQLLCYGYIAKRNDEFRGKKIKMGIYSLRSPGKIFMLKYGTKGIEKSMQKTDFIYTDEADALFSKILKKIIEEIFDRSKPFKKKDSENLYCKW